MFVRCSCGHYGYVPQEYGKPLHIPEKCKACLVKENLAEDSESFEFELKAEDGQFERLRRAMNLGEPFSLSPTLFLVPSSNSNGKKYLVNLKINTCTCPDFQYRKLICKHFFRVLIYLLQNDMLDSLRGYDDVNQR